MTQTACLKFAPLALVALASCGVSDHANQTDGGSSRGECHPHETELNQRRFQGRPADPDAIYLRRRGPDADAPLGRSAGRDEKLRAGRSTTPTRRAAPSVTGACSTFPSARSIGGGQRVGTEVTNDFGKPGYGGPCPPKGTDRIIITSSSSRSDVGRARASAGKAKSRLDVENGRKQHALARGELVGDVRTLARLSAAARSPG